MRRTAIAVATALVVLAAGVSAAFAGTRSYSGDFKHGGTLTFKAHVKNGTPTAVYGLHWKELPIDCAEGTRVYTSHLTGRIAVARRHFKATTHTSGNKASGQFEGRFTNHGKRAKGFFRVDGDFPPDLTDCHTGTARFKVK